MRWIRTPFAGFVWAWLLAGSASPLGSGSGDDLSSGAWTGEWPGIREALEAARHEVRRSGEDFSARNPAQQWFTRFDRKGFTTVPDRGDWTWGLELASYGFEGAEQVADEPLSARPGGRRFEVDRDSALTEWYVNDSRGLEHGFTLHRRPPGAATELTFTLRVRGELSTRVHEDGRGASFADRAGTSVLNYSGLVAFDADGVILPARLQRAGEALQLVVDERGARYPLTIDPVAQQAYLKASNTGVDDEFGGAVAISGNTVVVGAKREDSAATGVGGAQGDNTLSNTGAVYVFVRNGSVWSQQAYLKASNTGDGDQFGGAVDIDGDTLVVGAETEDSSATGINGDQGNDGFFSAGAAYVFVRNGTTWSQQAYLKASDTWFGDGFGSAVGISGDTVVVGSPFEDSNATGVNGNQTDTSQGESGAAYVFVRNGTNWSQQAYLKASNTDADDEFGAAVAVDGDTVIVGSHQEGSSATGINGVQGDNSAPEAGAAYVFHRSGTTWTQQGYIKASNTDGGDWFGYSVALSGDTAAVGSYFEASHATGINGDQNSNSGPRGAVYVFVRSGASWSQQAYVKASNTGPDTFGFSVDVSGDSMIVGARSEDSNATGVDGDQNSNVFPNSGAAYVFHRSGTTWSQDAYVKASNTGAQDFFGTAVAIAGNTAVVGAPQEDSPATGVNGSQSNNPSGEDSGAAYAFELSLPLGIAEHDLDQGETVTLDPGGDGGNASENAVVTVTNTTGPDDASVTVVESEEVGPLGSGFGVFGVDLDVETSLADGEFFMTLTMPFTGDDLGGAHPFLVDLAYFDLGSGVWELAASGNTENSPGHAGPLGDRFTLQGPALPEPAVPSTDLGDYGVFWNTATQKGYAWANVDHATHFRLGFRGMIPLGCGVNPEASLAPTDGFPVLGTTLTLGVDDPPGSSPTGALAFLLVSIAPDPNTPCGTALPGFGMSGPTGELLVGVLPPNPVVTLGPLVWSTPGVPVAFGIPIPADLSLAGVDLFLQGILASASTTRLTDGLQITLSNP